MIQVITVEREYGTQGAEYARRMAEHLGWELVDQSLVEEVARRAKLSVNLVQSCDEQLDPWYNKVGRTLWQGSNERAFTVVGQEMFDSTRMAGLTQEIMEEKARMGKCIIVGRGAACALHGVPSCFHTFVYASMARKIRWFEQTFPGKAHLAERELLATDSRRAKYVDHFYHNAWNDYRIYHLMLNSCMGFEAMIAATIEAMGI